MSWDSSLNTGIELIDNQHRELVEAVENNILASTDEKALNSFNSTLSFLETYVLQHFSDEEDYQKSSGYPDYHIHKSLHNDLIQDLNEIKNQIDREGINPELANSINQFLLDLVMHHISKADYEFGKYYKKWKNGLSLTTSVYKIKRGYAEPRISGMQ